MTLETDLELSQVLGGVRWGVGTVRGGEGGGWELVMAGGWGGVEGD